MTRIATKLKLCPMVNSVRLNNEKLNEDDKSSRWISFKSMKKMKK